MKNPILILKLTIIAVFFSTLLISNLFVYAGETQKNELSGAELWSKNCSRCHNMRASNEFNDSQWSIIVSHMRVIANIPGEEARKIVKFLQESNNPPQEPTKLVESKKNIQSKSIDRFNGNKENGKKQFLTYCASCHGNSGKGDGPASSSISPKPRNLGDKEYMESLTDEYLFNVIKYGGTNVGKSPFMPAWGSTIVDQDIKDIITYLHSLSE